MLTITAKNYIIYDEGLNVMPEQLIQKWSQLQYLIMKGISSLLVLIYMYLYLDNFAWILIKLCFVLLELKMFKSLDVTMIR